MALAFAVGMLTGAGLVAFTAFVSYRVAQLHAAEEEDDD